MAEQDDRTPLVSPKELNAPAARQGVKLGVMRYVLGISLVLTVTAFAVAWFVIRG